MILFYRIRILERIMDTWILIYQFYLPSTGQRMFYSHFQLENQPEISGLHFYYDCACSKQLQCLGSWSATFWLPGSRSAKICGSVDSVPRAKFQPKLYILPFKTWYLPLKTWYLPLKTWYLPLKTQISIVDH